MNYQGGEFGFLVALNETLKKSGEKICKKGGGEKHAQFGESGSTSARFAHQKTAKSRKVGLGKMRG